MNGPGQIQGDLLRDSKEQIITKGFVILPGLCGPKMLEDFLSVSLETSRAIHRALGDKDIGIGSAAGYIEIVQRSHGRWDIPISPRQFGVEDNDLPWWPLATALLGEDVEHSFSGVVSSEPESSAQEWHIDSPHLSAEHLPLHAINVLVALEDLPMEMGPTEFAIGSQVFTNHIKNPALVPEEMLYQGNNMSPELLVKETENPVPESFTRGVDAGSCIVFDDRILHRGGANRSPKTRHAAYFSYRKKGYVGTTHFESQRSVFDPGN